MSESPRVSSASEQRFTITRLLLAGALVGCSSNAASDFQTPTDTGIEASLDASIDPGHCSLEVESTFGGSRNNWILRNHPTTFYLVPSSQSCQDTLARGTPEIVFDRPLYRRAAQVCLTRNEVRRCLPTDFVYLPGGNIAGVGNFGSTLSVGPVNFNEIPGLPSNWNAIDVPVDINIANDPENLFIRTYTNFDWTVPTVSNVHTTRITPSIVDISFTSSEYGVWGVNVDHVTSVVSCSSDHKENPCDTGNYCVLQEDGYKCLPYLWGGRVYESGEQAISIPFNSRAGFSHPATLFFSDFAGNRITAPFTIIQ